jgi:hypothetical protein
MTTTAKVTSTRWAGLVCCQPITSCSSASFSAAKLQQNPSNCSLAGTAVGFAWLRQGQHQASCSTNHAVLQQLACSRLKPAACAQSVTQERSKTWLAHPRSARTKGVVHFLGGAFAGAAPQLLYNSFVELLADSGYTVIATPYKVTFQHDVCARQVRTGLFGLAGPLPYPCGDT